MREVSTQLVFINYVFRIYLVKGYPLAVKLGTITKEGKGDVYSYDEDDMVENPNLIQHLSHFGINILNLEKVQLIFILGLMAFMFKFN